MTVAFSSAELALGWGAGLLSLLYAVLAARELGSRTRVGWGWWLALMLPLAGAAAYLRLYRRHLHDQSEAAK